MRPTSALCTRLVISIVAFCAALSSVAVAQTPLVRATARHAAMGDFEITPFKYQCPSGYIPMTYSFTPQFPYDLWEEENRTLTDSGGGAVSRTGLTSAQINGGGYSMTMNNIEHHTKYWEAFVTCLSMAASSDNTFAFPTGNGSIPRQSTGTANAFCPADYPVALGGYSNADGRALKDMGSAPLWGTSASPVTLGSLSDGQTGPPTGWQVKVYNTNFSATVPAVAVAVCAKAPSLQAYVYSAPIPPAAFSVATPFSVFAPVPDGWTAVGSGYDGGQYGDYLSTDLWMQDGTLINALLWYLTTKTYDSGTAEVRAFMTQAGGKAPSGSGARAVMAVLAVPKPAPAPTSVPIVEFYNAALDHYFITGFAQEIADLDSGVHKGWARTGQTFSGYAPGSSGRTGRRPVCREYGNPTSGLDSHFYSASPEECTATLVNFGGAWLLEASEVFQMDLPDAATGACPAGGVPIYRVFNQRKDANHRYTTSTATRDQMVAKGGVAEGYGPNAVALCGLP